MYVIFQGIRFPGLGMSNYGRIWKVGEPSKQVTIHLILATSSFTMTVTLMHFPVDIKRRGPILIALRKPAD